MPLFPLPSSNYINFAAFEDIIGPNNWKANDLWASCAPFVTQGRKANRHRYEMLRSCPYSNGVIHILSYTRVCARYGSIGNL